MPTPEEIRRMRERLGLPPEMPVSSELEPFLRERLGPLAVPTGTTEKPPQPKRPGILEFAKAGGLPGAKKAQETPPLKPLVEKMPKLPPAVTSAAETASMVIPAFAGVKLGAEGEAVLRKLTSAQKPGQIKAIQESTALSAEEKAARLKIIEEGPLTPSVASEAISPAAKADQATEGLRAQERSADAFGQMLKPPRERARRPMSRTQAEAEFAARKATISPTAPVGEEARAVSESVQQGSKVAPTGAPPTPGSAVPPGKPPIEPPVTTGGMGEPPRPTPEEANAALGRLTQFIHSPESVNLSDLTVQIRRKQLGERLGHLQDRTEALLGQGVKFEDAMKQAQGETMSGAFDRPLASLSEVMADQFRDSAFARVYEVLKNEPLERMSTSEALTNALLGKGIPRTPGTAGGSAYSRLSRVFPPEVMAILEKDKALAAKFEDVLLQSGEKYKFTTPEGPWPPPFEMMGEQLPVGTGGKIAPVPMTPLKVTPGEQFQMGLPGGRIERPLGVTEHINVPTPELRGQQPTLGLPGGQSEGISATRPQPLSQGEMFDLQAFGMERPRPPSMPRYEPPIEAVVKMPSMMPLKDQNWFIKAGKEMGLTALDIANLLRANKSSFDFSWWRQQAPLILNNKRDFMAANLAAWKGMWSKPFAQAAEQRIKQDLAYYQHYEQAGYDFLRPLEQKGVPVWQREESYAILGSERPLAKFAEKIPWVRLSQRAFVTGTNEMNWRIFKRYVDNVYRMNEKIASGTVKLKTGEAFDVAKSIENHAKMLADMTGRAKLGPLREMSGAINAGFFSMRLNLGRVLTPRHLLSADPLVRKEAWKNIATFVGGITAVELAGQEMGLWKIELDPRSSDFMQIRIGPTRYDPWGGYRKYPVLMARLATQETKSGTTGEVRPSNIYSTGGRFVAAMGSPGASILSEFLTGETFVGEDVDLKSVKQWADRVAPMGLSDMYEAVEQQNSLTGLFSGIPSAVGVGVTSYGALEAKWEKELKLYSAIKPKDDTYAAAQAATKTRAALRVSNPEIDAKLFITGQVDAPSTMLGFTAAVRLMKENGISIEEVLPVLKAESPTRIAWRRKFEAALGIVPASTTAPKRPITTPTTQLSPQDIQAMRLRLGLPASIPTPVGAR